MDTDAGASLRNSVDAGSIEIPTIEAEAVKAAFASLDNYRHLRAKQTPPPAAQDTLPPSAPAASGGPYPHFASSNFLTPSFADRLLIWLENWTDWKHLQVQGFYDVNNFDLHTATLPVELARLTADSWLSELREEMSAQFGLRLGEKVNVEAQKMVAGQRIGVHSDFGGASGKACRLLIHINRGWDLSKGGLYMVLSEEFPADITSKDRVYPPIHNCAFGFMISERSFHAVSEIALGERYSIVYSFYPETPEATPSV